MKLFWKLMRREFVLFGNNQVAFLIFVGAPIAYGLLTGSVYKQATVKDLPIIVADLDNTPLSNKVTDALDDNQYLKVGKTVYESQDLEPLMMNEHYQAVVTIPDRFEADVQQRRHPEINVDVNGSNLLNANYATTGVQTVLAVINAGAEIESLKKKGEPQAIAEEQYESFRVTMARHFNSSSNYLTFLWPGIMGTIMQQVFLLALALSFAKEFEDNTFRNLIRYSKSTWFILFVKSLPYWLMGMLLWIPMMDALFALFHVPPVHSPLALWVLSGLFMFAVTFLGIAASLLFKTQLKATEVLMVIATPSFIISGQSWPLSQMPEWLQYLASVIPLTHFLEAYRKIMMFDACLPDLLLEIKWLVALSLASLAIAFVSLKYKISRSN